MGATNCPETPRQRLISMMYLVLTALLALNVSKEILDSFLIVNESLVVTNKNFTAKIEGTYNQFDIQKKLAEAKVLPFWSKAQQARKYSKDIIAFIEKTRSGCIAAEDRVEMSIADTINIRHITARDKYDESTNYLINEGNANKLKLEIEKYKKNMINLLDPKYRQVIEKSFGLDVEGPFYDADREKQDWEMHNFYHTILAADVVIFNKLIAEVKNAEYDVVNQLFSEVSIIDFKFDKIAAKIVPKSTYILTGGTFEADIFVAAYDTKQTPEIWIGDGVDSNTNQVLGNKTAVEGINGIGRLKLPAGGSGIRKYGGTITVANAAGKQSYPFSGEYIVAPPSATISATEMNVFYIGVDNPVKISVPGVANDAVKVTISGGGGVTITKTGDGTYNVKATTATTKDNMCKVTASAEMGGSLRPMGFMDFRVKKIPDPVPWIGPVRQSGVINKGILLASPIIPKMEGFDFNANFRIVSFSLTMNWQGDLLTKTTTGNTFSGEMKAMIEKGGRGTKIYLEDIKAVGPDGSTRTLSMNLKLN